MYISKQDIAVKRTAIRKRFPVTDGWKWSVTAMDDNIGVMVALMQYPEGYTFPAQKVIEYQSTAYHCGLLGLGESETKVLTDACDIMIDRWEEDAFYAQLSIGSWDKAATNVGSTTAVVNWRDCFNP